MAQATAHATTLQFTPMANKLVNYAVTPNGIAVIELASDASGAPLKPGASGPNTYTHEMMRDIDEAVLKARFDDKVTCIILTGHGEKFFSAGASIQMLNRVTPGYKYFFCLHANETLSRLEQTPKLVIAALNGHAVGGGLEIAMAADIRIARKDAGKTGLPEINLGVLAGTGGTQRLARIVGKGKAIELMVTGNNISFEEAKDLGIVQQIFDGNAADFRQSILDFAGQFTVPNKAAMAAGHIKRSVQSGTELPLEYGLALERELQAKLFASSDAKEGIAAYNEKRVAHFKGN
jgi:enoyl-CoA hydratase/carnithine racemase